MSYAFFVLKENVPFKYSYMHMITPHWVPISVMTRMVYKFCLVMHLINMGHVGGADVIL
jgi:hypothetical protein